MKIKVTGWWMIVAVFTSTWMGAGAGEAADPTGILKKPIPDKLVVMTFDDGPASHYNVVAPILKQHGFGGSFYVCDFDSFRTRKDWYLTWRQMREMSKDGLEIGNHTSGHAGGASIQYFKDNHYTGPTVVHLGTLVLAKAAALYGADTARWPVPRAWGRMRTFRFHPLRRWSWISAAGCRW